MEAVPPTLPELDRGWVHPVTAPGGGKGHFPFGEFFDHLLEFALENLTGGNGMALLGNPSSELAGPRTTEEILEGIRQGDFCRSSTNADLAFERQPGKEQCDLSVLGHLSGFQTAGVGEEDEALAVPGLEEHGSSRDETGLVCGGQSHGIGFGDLGRLQGSLKPMVELAERVLCQIGSPQSSRLIIASHFCHIHTGLACLAGSEIVDGGMRLA